MTIKFWKYHGNGNDFILTDEWDGELPLTEKDIAFLCNRHFGIGADGFLRCLPSEQNDFEMRYYNSDGKPASMCGNGGRCIAAFAFQTGKAGKYMKFDAFDGLHEAVVEREISHGKEYYIALKMNDVDSITNSGQYYFLDTGSPHYVEFVDNLAEKDVYNKGKRIRNKEIFSPGGTNVNFVEITDNSLFVRTYERGVEAETLSCGTGVTASSIAAYLKTGRRDFDIRTKGGNFRVTFHPDNGKFREIWLKGPARLVFRGSVELP